MPEFPHLPLPKKISRPFKFTGRAIEKKVSSITLEHLQNRPGHGRVLKKAIKQLADFWDNNLSARKEANLPDLPASEIIPLLLRVDTSLFSPDDLFSFGIDVIAENEGGYIIGAATDNFKSLKDKIDRFLANKGNSGKPSQLWEISQGQQWRVDYILDPALSSKWDKIADEDVLVVDVSIACNVKIPSEPSKKEGESDEHFLEKYQRWIERKNAIEAQQYQLEEERQEAFGNFINELDGVRLGSFVSYSDSFGCRVELKGSALKDLVLNYQYLFDVTEHQALRFSSHLTEGEIDIDIELTAPNPDCPKVCVIDSGIQEGHYLLNPAIDGTTSKSYLPRVASVMDEVSNGGHGTKVAGAVLYGNSIPKTGNHELDIWIRNARVLTAGNSLPKELFPPELMEDIVADFDDCNLFNLSITANRASKLGFMSQWAAVIDKLMSTGQKLFIVAAGNISTRTGNRSNPGIKEHLAANRSYPDYLLSQSARIAEPAQSCFALTVGSICSSEFDDADRKSFGTTDEPSAFTRTGPGIWRMVKPDVVEYGGDYIREKQNDPNLSQEHSVSAEVVTTTLHGGNAIGYDNGTSYAAPKVAHIAGKILNVVPDATANLVRALIVQSARLPGNRFRRPTKNDIRLLGYGIPSSLRATENSEQRITLTSEGNIAAKQAQIFSIKIPDEIRKAGDEYEILIEVTLAYTAIPRRTRRRTSSYLSTWVDWQSSKSGESYAHFRRRVTKLIDGDEEVENNNLEDYDPMHWNIREDVRWGNVQDYKRQDNSVQKDWIILKSYSLPSEFSIAVIGHQGWEKNVYKKVPFSLVVSFEVLNAEIDIYNKIRIENEIEIEVQTTE